MQAMSDALSIDFDLLRSFERHLNPQHPEQSRIPAQVLGYGEISTVFEIGDAGQRQVAYKRMPIFRSADELERYERIYAEYNRLLAEEIGLRVPPHAHTTVVSDSGQIVFYIAQQKFDPAGVGNRVIRRLSQPDVLRLVRRVLQELAKVWRFNASSDRVQVGLDGQISNWWIGGLGADQARLSEEIELIYLDTSTPLFRVDGQEQLDAELFLRSVPSFLAWLLRWLFLQDVVNRYYDFHLVVVDLIANFYKEQLAALVPDLVATTNDFFAGEGADLAVAPITEAEVRSYYREDALIWRLYQSFRRVDRFLHLRLLRRPYPYILPVISKR